MPLPSRSERKAILVPSGEKEGSRSSAAFVCQLDGLAAAHLLHPDIEVATPFTVGGVGHVLAVRREGGVCGQARIVGEAGEYRVGSGWSARKTMGRSPRNHCARDCYHRAGGDYGDASGRLREETAARGCYAGIRRHAPRFGFFLKVFDSKFDIVHVAGTAIGVFTQAAQDDLLHLRGQVGDNLTQGLAGSLQDGGQSRRLSSARRMRDGP